MTVVARALQVGAGALGVAVGYGVGSSVVRNAYRSDLVGAPSRIVEIDDRWIVDQPRAAQGTGFTQAMMGVGTVVAGAGAALVMGNAAAPAMTGASLLRHSGGAGLFLGGIGVVVGAIATSMQYRGADVRPAR